jgi:hypothetical protein
MKRFFVGLIERLFASEAESVRHGQGDYFLDWRNERHRFWIRHNSSGDICGLCGAPAMDQIHRVEKSQSELAARRNEAKI